MTFQEIMEWAKVFSQSQLYTYTIGSYKKNNLKYVPYTVAQCAVIIKKGDELGVPPSAALDGISIFMGKTMMASNFLAGLIKKSEKYDYTIDKLTPEICTITFYETKKENKLGTVSFTKQDAIKAGTANMDKFPEDMLFSRALSKGFRKHCGDLSLGGGVYVEGEIDPDINEVKDMPHAEENEENIEELEEELKEKLLNLAEELNVKEAYENALIGKSINWIKNKIAKMELAIEGKNIKEESPKNEEENVDEEGNGINEESTINENEKEKEQ